MLELEPLFDGALYASSAPHACLNPLLTSPAHCSGDAHEALAILALKPDWCSHDVAANASVEAPCAQPPPRCLNAFIDLTTGIAEWTSDQLTSNQSTVPRPGWTRPIKGSWQGASAWNGLGDSSGDDLLQDELPMPGCAVGTHIFTLNFNLDPWVMLHCTPKLSLDLSAAASEQPVDVYLNGRRLLDRAAVASVGVETTGGSTTLRTFNASELQLSNTLSVTLQVANENHPCGIYVSGIVSAYDRIPQLSRRVYVNETELNDQKPSQLDLTFDMLPPGSLPTGTFIVAEFSYTNPAGSFADHHSKAVDYADQNHNQQA